MSIVLRVEGEIVEPDTFDKLYDWLNQQHKEGKLTKAQLRHIVGYSNRLSLDPDAGRALAAATGGAIGSLYRWMGAATGAGLGALLYDFVAEAVKRRQITYEPDFPLLEAEYEDHDN